MYHFSAPYRKGHILRLRHGFSNACITTNPKVLGDLPDNVARTRFDMDGWPTEDEDGMLFTHEHCLEKKSLHKMIAETWDCPPSLQMRSNGEVDMGEYEPHSPSLPGFTQEDAEMVTAYPAVYETMFWNPTAVRVDGKFHLDYQEETSSYWGAFPRIDAEEARLLGDLLSQIFVYDPLRRPTAQEVMAHPWFTYYERD